MPRGDTPTIPSINKLEVFMKEVWKDIKGYEGLYQVSNLGRVKSLDRIVYQKKFFW